MIFNPIFSHAALVGPDHGRGQDQRDMAQCQPLAIGSCFDLKRMEALIQTRYLSQPVAA